VYPLALFVPGSYSGNGQDPFKKAMARKTRNPLSPKVEGFFD
jgi:hypothetical protein